MGLRHPTPVYDIQLQAEVYDIQLQAEVYDIQLQAGVYDIQLQAEVYYIQLKYRFTMSFFQSLSLLLSVPAAAAESMK